MIYVVPITPWELFKILCTVPEVAEFNDILFKASGKKSISSKQISTIRSALQMKTLMKSRPGKKKQKAEDGEARLTSNFILLQIYTKQYPRSTGKGSSLQIVSLECLGYSEPICSILVKPTQTRMGVRWTPSQKCHRGIQTANIPFVWERIRLSTYLLS